MALTTIDLSKLDGSDGFRLETEDSFGFYFGTTVNNVGDIDGDGFDDVMIGAPYEYRNSYQGGKSYVVFGKASGFDAVNNVSSLDGKNGFQFMDSSGASPYLVSGAGDIDGDGFDDVIIGAQGTHDIYAPYTHTLGAAYVVFGKAADFDALINLSSLNLDQGFSLDVGESIGLFVNSAGDVNNDGFDDVLVSASGGGYVVFGQSEGFDAAIDLSLLTGKNGFRLDGASGSVSSAGDINGDGFDDVIVRSSDSGFADVVFGKSGNFEAALDLSSLDGSDGFHLIDSTFNPFSISVARAGDINGDGFDDVIISDGFANLNGDNTGSCCVVFGKASGFTATFDLSHLDGNNGFRLVGEAPSYNVGMSASDAGDVNGDGFDDLIVSASDYSYVVLGKDSGFAGAMSLSSMDGNDGFRLDLIGVGAGSVSGAGDVNGDGFDDLIIGDRLAKVSYVVFGGSDLGSAHPIKGTSGDDVLRGTTDADIFEAGDGNDLMIGLGGADIFHGGNGVDQIKVTDLNFQQIDGGSGNDILHTAGENLNLDLTDYVDIIQGIETICLYGRGDNTMALTGAELQALSDTTDTLKVHGNAGDQVILEGHWVDEGSSGFYHTYTQDDAVLLVGMNMTAVVA